MHEPELLVQIVKVEIEAFAWSIPQLNLMGFNRRAITPGLKIPLQ